MDSEKKNSRLIYLYLKVFTAIFLSAGILLPVMAFIPITDDFGNSLHTSLAMKLVVLVIGLLCFLLAIFLCVPSVFRRRNLEQSDTLEDA